MIMPQRWMVVIQGRSLDNAARAEVSINYCPESAWRDSVCLFYRLSDW